MSVRPSICKPDICVEIAKRIIKLFSPSGSHIILVFFALNTMAITGASNAGWV